MQKGVIIDTSQRRVPRHPPIPLVGALFTRPVGTKSKLISDGLRLGWRRVLCPFIILKEGTRRKKGPLHCLWLWCPLLPPYALWESRSSQSEQREVGGIVAEVGGMSIRF